jgi:putative effector of murein hydrolase LrgA (UPF0299 family)
VILAATIWEILWTLFAGTIIVGIVVLLIVDALDGKATWPGRAGALLFIPAGVAMAEGEAIVLAVIGVCMAALAAYDRRARSAPARLAGSPRG